MSDLIVSVHVPKTGGVSFREALAEWAGGHMVQDYGDRPLAPRSRWRSAQLPPGTRVVHGHFVAAKYGRSWPEARFVTWFRDLVERLASHYHYWLREPDPGNPTRRRLLEERLDLAGFAALPGDAQRARALRRRSGRGLRLRRAHRGVRRGDGAVPPPDLPGPELVIGRRNVNPARSGERYALEPAEREAIAALNRADLALHARARARYEELLAGTR